VVFWRESETGKTLTEDNLIQWSASAARVTSTLIGFKYNDPPVHMHLGERQCEQDFPSPATTFIKGTTESQSGRKFVTTFLTLDPGSYVVIAVKGVEGGSLTPRNLANLKACYPHLKILVVVEVQRIVRN
jgi:uncharacterized protein (DUF2141 family)